MDSLTTTVARQYRLQQWAEDIRECQNRTQDLTVKDWCEQHQITVPNYYYRLRQVRKACLENIPLGQESQNIVPIPSELIDVEEVSESSGIEIVVNGIKVHVKKDTSPELLKMVLQVAVDVK